MGDLPERGDQFDFSSIPFLCFTMLRLLLVATLVLLPLASTYTVPTSDAGLLRNERRAFISKLATGVVGASAIVLGPSSPCFAETGYSAPILSEPSEVSTDLTALKLLRLTENCDGFSIPHVLHTDSTLNPTCSTSPSLALFSGLQEVRGAARRLPCRANQAQNRVLFCRQPLLHDAPHLRWLRHRLGQDEGSRY